MAKIRRVPRGDDPHKYSTVESRALNTSSSNGEPLCQNEITLENQNIVNNLRNSPDHNEHPIGDDQNAASGNGGQNDSLSNEDVAQTQADDDRCFVEVPLNAKRASSFSEQQNSSPNDTDEKVDFNVNPIILTMLMVSNLVGEREDELFIDSRACPVNARYIYMSRLSCIEPEDNLFMRLLEERPDKSVSSVFDGNYILTLTGLKYKPTHNQFLCEEYSPLLSTSRNNFRLSDLGTFVAVPLTNEVLIQALGKLGYSDVEVYKSLNKLNLVRSLFRALSKHAPRNNSFETLQAFIQTHLKPFLNETTELWGVEHLDSKFDQRDTKFLRRFIQLNFSRIYGIGLHVADGIHRLTSANNALCGFNPSEKLTNSHKLVDRYFESMPHCDGKLFNRLERKINVYIPTRLNEELFTHFISLSLESQKAQKNGQPHNLLDFYSMVYRNVDILLPSLYIWDHATLHRALSNRIYTNPENNPKERQLDEPFVKQLFGDAGLDEGECQSRLTELKDTQNAKKRSKDISVAGFVLSGIIHNTVKIICQAITSRSIPTHLIELANKYGNINVDHFADSKQIVKGIFRSKLKNTFNSWTPGIRPFPFTMNGLEDIIIIFQDNANPFSDEKKETLFKRDLEGGVGNLTQDEVIFVYLLFCSRLSKECHRLLGNFFQGRAPKGPQVEQRSLPTNESIKAYLRAAFFLIRQSVLKSRNIWKKVIFKKTKFVHPIQELDDDLIFLTLLPSGVEMGIGWMLHRGISPVLSTEERDLCNDLKEKATLKQCQCEDTKLARCTCAIPFGNMSMYAILVFSYQMKLHLDDTKIAFKEWLMTHWDAERNRIRNRITEEEYAKTEYDGGGTNKRIFSDCISHLTVGGAESVDPRGRDGLQLFNLVRYSPQSPSFPQGRVTCVMSEFSLGENRVSIWQEFNRKVSNWKSITQVLAAQCPVTGRITARREQGIANDDGSRVLPNPSEGQSLPFNRGNQNVSVDNDRDIGHQKAASHRSRQDADQEEGVSVDQRKRSESEPAGSVVHQRHANKKGRVVHQRDARQREADQEMGVSVNQRNRSESEPVGGPVRHQRDADQEMGEAVAPIQSDEADMPGVSLNESDEDSCCYKSTTVGTFCDKPERVCYPFNIFPLIRGHRCTYTSVRRVDWMIFHHMICIIKNLRDSNFSCNFVDLTMKWKVIVKSFKSLLKSLQASRSCVICQNNKATNFDKSVKETFRGYCIDCSAWIESMEGQISGLLISSKQKKKPHPQLKGLRIHIKLPKRTSDDEDLSPPPRKKKRILSDSESYDDNDILSDRDGMMKTMEESGVFDKVTDLSTTFRMLMDHNSEAAAPDLPLQYLDQVSRMWNRPSTRSLLTDRVIQYPNDDCDASQSQMSELSAEEEAHMETPQSEQVCSYCNVKDLPTHECTVCKDKRYHNDCYKKQTYYPLYQRMFSTGGLCSECYQGKMESVCTCCAGPKCSHLSDEGGSTYFLPGDALSTVRSCAHCKFFLHSECSCGTDDMDQLQQISDVKLADGYNALCKLCFTDILNCN